MQLKGATSSTSADNASHHRTKPAKQEKQLAPLYEQQQQQQQLSELDQAVSSITGHVNVEAQQQQQQRQHQVDLSGVTEEPLPMHNTSDDNSNSLMLDDMLDSKFINDILNNVEADIPFDESALDTSQSQSQPQQQQQQQLPMEQHAQATKRLRFDEGSINTDAGEYAAALYQQQLQQVYSEEHQPGTEQTQLTAIDAMQLQQLIYQQQQMLEHADQQQQHQQQQQHHHLPMEQQEQLKQEQLSADVAAAQQFSVYNVPSLTDDAEDATGDEHMILPTIYYDLSDNNQVSVLDQQSQQQAIAELLTQAGYDNVDVNVNVLQATAAAMPTADNVGMANHFNDELNDFDFTKLETVCAEANHTTKTVKLENNQLQQQPLQPPLQQQTQQQGSTYHSYESENPAQPHRQLVNAKYHDDSTYFNMTLYAGPPRPLAMNTFDLVKLPNGMGATLRKNLLMTRKANNSLLSLNGSSGVVGTLARPPPPLPASSLTNSLNNCNGNASMVAGQQWQPRTIAAHGKTIYAQKSSVISQERLRCNKRALLSRLGSTNNNNGLSMTVKRLNELLTSKIVKSEREKLDKVEQQHEANEQQLQQDHLEQQQKRMHSFYEKRRKLLSTRHQRHHATAIGSNSNNRHFMRQRPMHLPLQLQSGGGGGVNAIGSPSPQQQLLKKQLLRTLSDNSNILASGASIVAGGLVSAAVGGSGGAGNGNGSTNPWKSNSSTPGSNSTGSDLMRVFV